MNLAELKRGDNIILQHERKPSFLLYRELEAESHKEWLVHNLLGAGDASAVYGVPGCGKSVLVEDMALHIATGREWHGRPVTRGAVLYVALERKKLVERRAIAFRERHQIPDVPFAIMGGMFDLRGPNAVDAIVAAVRQVEAETAECVVLIIIDTISRALCGGDENSPKDMGAIVAATSRLQAGTKAHILWVHHMPQDGAERLRGHGALLGAMDTTIHVEKLSDDARSATVMKANDSEEGERVTFTLESVTIGPETTAPVVVPADPALAHSAPAKRRLSGRNKLALDCLTEAVLNHGQPPPVDLELPQGVKAVTLDEWRSELLRRNVIDREAANPRTDFRRCLTQLADRGLISSNNNLVWPV